MDKFISKSHERQILRQSESVYAFVANQITYYCDFPIRETFEKWERFVRNNYITLYRSIDDQHYGRQLDRKRVFRSILLKLLTLHQIYGQSLYSGPVLVGNGMRLHALLRQRTVHIIANIAACVLLSGTGTIHTVARYVT